MPPIRAPQIPDGIADLRSGAQAQALVPDLLLFELPSGGEWEAGDPAQGEPDRMPKMVGCRRVVYLRETKEYKATERIRSVTLWHSIAMGSTEEEREANKETFGTTGEWPAPFDPGDWVLARFDRQAGRWEIVFGLSQKVGVRIAETDEDGIAAGGSATVSELNMDGSAREDGPEGEEEPVTYTAYNVFTSAIGGERRILTLPWRHDPTKEIVIAEDCPS